MAWPRAAAPATSSGQALAGRHPDLPGHQVEAGHQLGDAVLDLEPRVHLEEVVAAIGVEQELDRRRVVEVDAAGDPPRALEQRRADGSGSTAGDGDSSTSFWWRRWTLQSRSPSDRQAAVPVAEQLDLDVPRGRDAAARRRASRRRRPPAPRAGRRPARPPASAAESTRRIPRPPPPAAAFSISGKPTAARSAESLLAGATVVPGTIGTPAARRRAARPACRRATPGSRPAGRRRRARRPRRPGRTPRSRTGSRSPDGSPRPRRVARRRGSPRSTGTTPSAAADRCAR